MKTTETYLSSRHAIETCLELQGTDNYYAYGVSLWISDQAQNAQTLIAKARSLKIPTHTIQSVSQIPEPLRQDFQAQHHILFIEPIAMDLDTFDWESARTLVVVDHITDSQNLAAIIRSAAAMKADALFYPKHNQASITSRIRFIAQGAAEVLPCYKVPNINQWLKQAQKNNFWVYGFTEKGPLSLHTTQFSTKTVLIIGSEDKGIRQKTEDVCDFLLHIPTSPTFSCLNAASAASIILYERYRQMCLEHG